MTPVAALELLDRYGPAIEWDMRERLGVDVLGYFQGVRPWRQFARLLGQLQQLNGTALWTARAQDEALAQEHLARYPEALDPPTKASPPPLRDMSTEVQLLLGISDMVGLVVDSVGQLGGADRAMTPAPRPTTALDRVRQRVRMRKMDDLLLEALEAQARGTTDSD